MRTQIMMVWAVVLADLKVCSCRAGQGEAYGEGADENACHRAKLPGHHQTWRVQDGYHAGRVAANLGKCVCSA